MRQITFRNQGARQATKGDLIDILCALDPSRRRDQMDTWTVNTLRTALAFAFEQFQQRRAHETVGLPEGGSNGQA